MSAPVIDGVQSLRADVLSEEHYRRSADCSFFVFALPTRKSSRSSRSKKSRSSKASRLSTQSTASVDSETTAITEDTLDTSVLSQSTGKSSKGSKRTAASRRKKTKKDDSSEASAQMEADTPEESKPTETVKVTRATRGKKRTSEEVVEYIPTQATQEPSPVPEGRPRKRRATRSQSSAVKEMGKEETKQDIPDDTSLDEDIPPAIPEKGRRGSKRSSITTASRTAGISMVTKASLRSRIPDDSELEEALEADLERDMSDDEPFEFQYKDENAERARRGSVSASVAVTRVPRLVDEEIQEDYAAQDNALASEEDPDITQQTKAKARKQTERKATAKKCKKDITPEPESRSRPEPEPVAEPQSEGNHEVKDYQVEENPSEESRTAAIEIDEKVDESSHEVAVEPPPEEPIKKRAPSKAKKPAKPPINEDVAASTSQGDASLESMPQAAKKTRRSKDDVQNVKQTPSDNAERFSGRVSNVPPKTVQRYSDIPREKQHTQTLLESMAHDRSPENRAGTARVQTRPVTMQETTPSPSPQSSDAENQPPSSRPSATRPPLFSPSRSQTARVPLAASTPSQSPSKRRPNMGHLISTFPWTPVDIDELLFGDSEDKENHVLRSLLGSGKDVLSSPEKKMTVEEWIKLNAEKGAEQLRRECERVVGLFEREGGRAMKALEGIECID